MKLKHALFCRILIYIIVLIGPMVPCFISLPVKAIPEQIKSLLCIAGIAFILIYIIENFALLVTMDIIFAYLHNWQMARKKFSVNNTAKIEKRISRYGTPCAPNENDIRLKQLRYKFTPSVMSDSKGTERIVALYQTDVLDLSTYRSMLKNAKDNSDALTDKRKQRILDKNQRKARTQRATVILIIAECIDVKLKLDLYERICTDEKADDANAVIPCVIDLSDNSCVFSSLFDIYTGNGSIPAVNKGKRIIKKLVFGGRLPLKNNNEYIKLNEGYDLEETLWQFWKTTKRELIDDEKATRKRYQRMQNKQIELEDDFLYIKWDDRGLITSVNFTDGNIAEVDPVEFWCYPKKNKISKATAEEIRKAISNFLRAKGYKAKFQ